MKKTYFLLIALALLTGAQLLQAGTHLWSGAQDGKWGNPANWSSGGTPSAFEAAPVVIQFPSAISARRQTTNNILNLNVDVLAIYGGNYELHGITITLTGNQPLLPYTANLMSASSATNYFNLGLVLSKTAQILVGSGAVLEFDADLSGPGGFIKIGSGTLWFLGEISDPPPYTGRNFYQGPATVLDGSLMASTWGYSGWLDFWGHPVTTIPGELIIGDTNMAHSAKVELIAGGELGSTPLTIKANGTIELSGNTAVTALTLDGGTVRFMPIVSWNDGCQCWDTNYSRLDCGTNVTSHVNRFGGGSAILGSGALSFQPTNSAQPCSVNVVNGSLLCEAGIQGSFPFSKLGDGEFIFQGSDQHNGDWIVQEGIMAISSWLDQSTHSLTVSNGAQVSVRGPSSLDLDVHLNGFGIGGTNGALVIEHDGAVLDSKVHVDSDTAIVVTNVADTVTITKYYVSTAYPLLTGPGSLTKKGRGTLRLTGNQTNGMIAPFLVDQGTLLLDLTQNVAGISSPLFIGHNVADGTTAEVKLLHDNELRPWAPITISDSGTLNLYGTHQTAGPLTLMGGDIKTFMAC